MKRLPSLLIVLLLACSAWASEVVITPPATPAQPFAVVMLPVSGLDVATLDEADIECVPAPALLLAVPIKGKPTLLFQAASGGKYKITLGLNTWRGDLDAALAKASAAKIKPDLLAGLASVVGEIDEAYPLVNASCVLEVTGTVPFDPNDPNDPNQPPNKVTQVTLIYEKDEGMPPRPVLSALDKINRDTSRSIQASAVEDDSLDGDGEAPEQYKVALEAARKAGLPALVVQAGSMVVKVVKDPKTEQEVLEAIQ